MKIQLVNITGRHSAVAVDVCTGEFIPKQYLFSLCVKVCLIDITDTDSAVAVDIALVVQSQNDLALVSTGLTGVSTDVANGGVVDDAGVCLLYTSPSPRD